MTRAEAEAWGAGSAVTVSLFHATTATAAAAIRQRGLDRRPWAGDRGVRYEPLTPEEFRARAAELRAEAVRLRQRGAAD